MKRQIRFGVFETNSSSTHSLTMCSVDDYISWKNGDVLLNENWRCDKGQFVTLETAISHIKSKNSESYYDDEEMLRDNEFYTYEEYFENEEYLEIFEERHVTPKGEEIVAFGKYGND